MAMDTPPASSRPSPPSANPLTVPPPAPLDDAQKRYRDAMLKYLCSDQAFANMPAMKEAKIKWEAKGYADDDPIFLVIELLGCFESKGRMMDQRIMEAVEAASDLNHIATLEACAAVQSLQPIQKTLADLNRHLEETSKQNAAILAQIEKLIKALPVYHQQVKNATILLDNQAKLKDSLLINVGLPLVTFLLGFGVAILVVKLCF